MNRNPLLFIFWLLVASLVNCSQSADKVCNLPQGRNTVKVSIINPTRFVGFPPSVLVTPDINGTTLSDFPSLSAFIEHRSFSGKTTRLLFDLGVRKDWENLPPAATDSIRALGVTIYSLGEPSTQLQKYGIKPETIDHIIFSHSHFDHAGNLNLFPKSTSVIVGPGFKAAHLPGYPNNPDSPVDQTGYDGRDVQEVDFGHKAFKIASLNAVDHFGDGSLYLINAPGHDQGHIAALARTTKGRRGGDDTFILLAGDSTHHEGAFRPTTALPLPRHIPNRQHLLDIHPKHSATEPFYHVAASSVNLNATEMENTLSRLEQLDVSPNVLTVIAHDYWLLGVVELFPKLANEWKSKGWGDKRFRFVQDFA